MTEVIQADRELAERWLTALNSQLPPLIDMMARSIAEHREAAVAAERKRREQAEAVLRELAIDGHTWGCKGPGRGIAQRGTRNNQAPDHQCHLGERCCSGGAEAARAYFEQRQGVGD